MSHFSTIFLVIILLSLKAWGCGSGGSAPLSGSAGTAGQSFPSPTHSVTVAIPVGSVGKGPSAYGANPFIIVKGTTVTWVNEDSMPHTATSNDGVWDSSVLAQGQSFSFTFNTLGSFPYYCTVHGKDSMFGVIQVNASGG